jgi:type II secretory pathway component PulM
MAEVSPPGDLTALSIVGFKSALQSQRVLASVVTDALANVSAANEAAAAQPAPSGGRGQVVNTSA